MAEYILREQAIIAVTGAKLPDVSASGLPIANGKRSVTDCVRRLKDIPAADVVSRGAYDQTDWERCVALTQLKEIGKSLGERMDDVRPVVLCRDCVNYGEMLSGYDHRLICHKFALTTKPDDFCSRGERRNCGADMREES